MQCIRCGKCCERTEMPLSIADVKRLKKAGYKLEEFAFMDKDGYIRLKNKGKWCYFYDPEKKVCKIYEYRPLGCRLYPIIYCDGVGIIVDEICPMKDTFSEVELRTKGKILIKHLRDIENARYKWLEIKSRT